MVWETRFPKWMTPNRRNFLEVERTLGTRLNFYGLGNAFPEMDDVNQLNFFMVWEMRFPKWVTSNQTEFFIIWEMRFPKWVASNQIELGNAFPRSG